MKEREMREWIVSGSLYDTCERTIHLQPVTERERESRGSVCECEKERKRESER